MLYIFYGAFAISIILLVVAGYLAFNLTKKIGTKKLKTYWVTISILIPIFATSYLITMLLVSIQNLIIATYVTWILFFIGACFVLITVNAGRLIYLRFTDIRAELDEEIKHIYEINHELEDTSKAVADANVNLAQLYNELEDAKHQLEEKEASLSEQNIGLFNANKSLADANANMAELYIELDNAQKSLQEKNSELLTANTDVMNLNRLARVVNSSLEFKDIAESFIPALSDIFTFNVITLHSCHEDHNLIIQDRVFGLTLNPEKINQYKKITIDMTKDSSLIVDSFKRKQPVLVKDINEISEMSRADKSLYELLPWQSAIYFPLMVSQKVIGVVGFYKITGKLMLSEQDIMHAQEYLVQASTAINNARIYHDLKKTKIQLAESEKINALSSTFRKFVPEQFLKKIAQEGIENISLGKAELTDLAILFIDIRDFTKLSENISELTLYKFVNGYFDSACEGIYENHGFIDKFIGDGIMALFDNDKEYEYNATTNAIKAAIAIQKSLLIFNQKSSPLPNYRTAVGLGLHAGEVLMGTVGTSQHFESTVLGENVNIASRIEGFTKAFATDILITEAVLSQVDPRVMFKYRPLGFVNVRGIAVPINIFEIYEHNDESHQQQKDQTVPILTEAFACLKAKDHTQGLSLLKSITEQYPDDLTIKRVYDYNKDMIQ